MATLQYRTSDNWEILHSKECPTKFNALKIAYQFTIGDWGISIGDIIIDGNRYTHSEIEEELFKLWH